MNVPAVKPSALALSTLPTAGSVDLEAVKLADPVAGAGPDVLRQGAREAARAARLGSA